MGDRHQADEHLVDDLAAARERIAELKATAARGDSGGRALRGSEERFRALVQFPSDLVTITDPGGTYQYASPSRR